MPNITLYGMEGACSVVPHLILQYTGVPFKHVQMQRAYPDEPNRCGLKAVDGSLSADEFLKLNPKGFVPTLEVEEDGKVEVITELPAVVSYITSLEQAPGSSINPADVMGRTAVERAKTLEWLVYLSTKVQGHGFASVVFPWTFAARDSDDGAIWNAIRATGMEVVLKGYEHCENRVREGDAGISGGKDGRFSAADFHLYYHYIKAGNRLGSDIEKTYPALTELARKVDALESVRQVCKIENLATLA